MGIIFGDPALKIAALIAVGCLAACAQPMSASRETTLPAASAQAIIAEQQTPVVAASAPTPAVQQHTKSSSKHADREVHLEGKIDKRDSAEYNLGLDQRRADNVKEKLELGGKKANQLHVLSYGEERPKAIDHNGAMVTAQPLTSEAKAKAGSVAVMTPENHTKPPIDKSMTKGIGETPEIAIGTEVPWVVNKPPKIYAESNVPIEVVLQPGKAQEFLSRILKNDVGNKFVGSVITGGAEYTKRMRASLTGDKDEFEIIPLPEKSDGWQKIELDHPTRWAWNVTPKKTGKLMLYVTIESDFGDGVRHSLPKPHEIEVEVSWVYVIHIGWQFIKENYDVLAGIFAALGAILTWILKRRKRTLRRAERIAVPPHD